MQPVGVETQRLILRQWLPGDAGPFADMCADPEVMRWIGAGTTLTRTESLSAMVSFQQPWQDDGFGLFALELAETGEFAGFCGFAVPRFLPEILPCIEIGWRLPRSLWGRGLATEAARACLRFGFEDLGLDEVVSIHQIGNDASQRIMMKLGMKRERTTTDPSCRKRVNVYRIRRVEPDCAIPGRARPRGARR